MSFDPATFMNAQYDEALDTVVVPCPVGEYKAISDKVEIVPWTSNKGEGSSGVKLVILWDIQDDNVKQLLGRDKVVVRQEQMLDLTETGQLDLSKGRNVGLGRIREALGLNTPGQPFAFPMLQGQMANVAVTHRAGQNPDELYAEIKRISKPV